jgi:hypothetical protein
MANTRLRRARVTVDGWATARRDQVLHWVDFHTGRDLSDRQATALGAAGLIVAAALALALGWLLVQILEFVASIFRGLATLDVDVRGTGAELVDLPVVQLIIDPIVSWVDVHSTGSGLTTGALLRAWVFGGLVLVLAGLFGSRGARIAWPLYGTATVAMAWAGSPELHRPVVAGLTGLAWALLSIVVLHRGGTRRPGPRIIVNPAPVQVPRTDTTRPSSTPASGPLQPVTTSPN